MRPSRLVVAVAVAAAALVAAGGCGGGGGGDDGAGEAGAELCRAAEAQLQALSDLYDAAGAGLPADQVAATAGRARAAGRDLVEAAPDDLADDAAVLAGVGDRLAESLATDGPSPSGVPDDVAEAMASPEYRAASDRMAVALEEECGAAPGAA